jgi:hypothetical protein
MSCGAVAVHCARRDLVLLRDIVGLGTATSLLLCLSRHGVRPVRRSGRSGVPVRYIFPARSGRLLAGRMVRPKVLQQRPHLAALLVAVAGLGISQPCSALCAQPFAVLAAERRQRQFKHNRVAQRRLQVQQSATVQPVAVICVRLLQLVVTSRTSPECRRGLARLSRLTWWWT